MKNDTEVTLEFNQMLLAILVIGIIFRINYYQLIIMLYTSFKSLQSLSKWFIS